MRGAPQVTFDLDTDQPDQLAAQRGPTASSTPAGQEPFEPLAMPSDDCGRLGDGQGVPPRLPTTGQDDPQPGPSYRSENVAEGTREDPDLVPKPPRRPHPGSVTRRPAAGVVVHRQNPSSDAATSAL